jgi:hypothetical protein
MEAVCFSNHQLGYQVMCNAMFYACPMVISISLLSFRKEKKYACEITVLSVCLIPYQLLNHLVEFCGV